MKNDDGFVYLLSVATADNSAPTQGVMAFSTREGAEDCKAEFEMMDDIIGMGFNNIWKIELIPYEPKTIISDESDLEFAKAFAEWLSGSRDKFHKS